jgi:TATA-box binding protein (TBP) (component of TFIID and TFIIIB)
MELENEWLFFINNGRDNLAKVNQNEKLDSSICNISQDIVTKNIPTYNETEDNVNQYQENNEKKINDNISNIYISTKTNIIYLNSDIDINNIFWKLNLIKYDSPEEGFIKKQIKISCKNPDELQNINNLINKEEKCDIYIINSIDNPDGRVKFKHVQKLTIGMCKKDLTNNRTREKSAFYNCVVAIIRILYNNKFYETHVKIFNTGKLEIPGLKNDIMFKYILDKIIKILQLYENKPIYYNNSNIETILINSNFYCNFNIKRQELYNKLRVKYNIHTCYDPCSYPGIQCAYYYNNNMDETQQPGYIENNCDKNDYTKVSFMIFRTGSVLIVGKCTEKIINFIYHFIKKVIINEYNDIYSVNDKKKKKLVSKKKCKKYCYFTNNI